MSNLIVNILSSFLGTSKKHNEGRGQIAFDCPACAEDKGLVDGDGKGNLEINYKKGVFKCWSCYQTNNIHGLIPKLIKRYGTKENLRNYLLIKPDVIDDDSDGLINDIKLPEGFKLLSKCNTNYWKYDRVIKYLKDRGITDEIIGYYKIGYTVEGEFKNRVIIPSYDMYDDLNYFVARGFEWWVKPKYMNPEIDKQTIIFNEKLINWDSTIYLVEGPFDHIIIPNSIPLLGKYISTKLLELLHDNARGNIVIVLDDDAYDDAIELYKQLNFGDLYGRILICEPPYGYDPSSIFEKLGNKGIMKLLKNSRIINPYGLY